MMHDLLDKRSAKDKLWDWMKERPYTKTSEVLKWGTKNFSNRAFRNAQTLATEGKIRRLTDDETHKLFGFIKESVWTPTGFFK